MTDLATMDLGGKTPRWYQVLGVEQLRESIAGGKRAPILCGPTGSGKTAQACMILKLAIAKRSRAIFLANRRELIKQASNHLDDCGVFHGIILAGHEWRREQDAPVQVASRQTLASRAIRSDRIEMPDCDLLILDECHGSVTKENLQIIKSIREKNPKAVMIGLTATPARGDNKGLGGLFDDIIQPVSYAKLRQEGFLVPATVKALHCPDMNEVGAQEWDRVAAQRVDKPKLVGDIYENWKLYADDRQTVVFGKTKAHSRHLRDMFSRKGVRVAHIDEKTPVEERAQILADLGTGAIQVLCNVGICCEGWDEPCVSAVVLACPTRSLVKYRQCLDQETEILTEYGWRGIDDPIEGLKVASFNMENDKIEMCTAMDQFSRLREPDEQMVEIVGPHLDVRVTEGHNLVYRNSRKTSWFMKTAGELIRRKHHFFLPCSGVENSPGIGLSRDELEFLGWFVSDGWVNRKTATVNICQAKEENLNKIKSCLDACRFKYSHYVRERTGDLSSYQPIHTWSISAWNKKNPPIGLRGWWGLREHIDKELAPATAQMSQSELVHFLRTLNFGDGAAREFNSDGSFRRTMAIVCGKETQLADRLQSLCVRRGYRCNISQVQNGRVMRIKPLAASTVHPTGTDGRTSIEYGTNVRGERVWCVTTRLGTIVTRRNGKVAVLGNCSGRALRPFEGKDDCVILDHAGACFLHCMLPDDDIDWKLKASESAVKDLTASRRSGEAKEPSHCEQCHSMYYGKVCPSCGSKRRQSARAIGVRHGLLKEVKRGTLKPGRDATITQKSQYWRYCLFTMAGRGSTMGAAARMYSKEIGEMPWQTKGLQDVPGPDRWRQPVSQVYPWYERKKKDASRSSVL